MIKIELDETDEIVFISGAKIIRISIKKISDSLNIEYFRKVYLREAKE